VIQYVLGLRNLRGVGEPPVDYFAENLKPKQSSTYIAQMATVLALTVITIIVLGSSANSLFPSLIGKEDTVLNFLGLAFNFSIAIKYVLMPVVLVAGLIAVFLTGLQDKLTTDDWKRIGIILILFAFATIFWMGYEQAGSSLNLFAEQSTNRQITTTWEFPTAWFQSVSPFFIVTFAPLFAWVWVALGKRQPSEELKFSIGLVLTGSATLSSRMRRRSWAAGKSRCGGW
jgi:dipeptide/tripeptide permease